MTATGPGSRPTRPEARARRRPPACSSTATNGARSEAGTLPAVNDTVWAAQNTSPAAVEAALRELLIERHNESDGYVPARVLNLVCIVERQWSGEIANRRRETGDAIGKRTERALAREGRSAA